MNRNDDLRAALAQFERAATQFDELYTSITLVQRQLLGLRKTLSTAPPDALDEQGQRSLIQKLHEVTVVLDDFERFTTPGRRPINARSRSARSDLADVRRRLADQTLTPGDLRDAVLGSDRRDSFAAIEAVAEYMEDEPENDLGLARVPIGSLLLLVHHIGRGTVTKIFNDAELPDDPTFGELGPGDSARLSDALHSRIRY